MAKRPDQLRGSGLDLGGRLLVSFVLSALIPIALAMTFAYFQVTDHLRTQSEQRLRRASKAVGLELLDRLQAIDWALSRYDAGVGLPPDDRAVAGILEVDGGRVTPVNGAEAFPFVPPTLEEWARLDTAGKLLRTVGSEPPAIEILRRMHRSRSGLLVARIDATRFFDVEEQAVLPRDSQICVLQGADTLHCQGEPPATHPDRGSFRYEASGDEWYAHAYPLFLQAEFQSVGWTVLLSEPRAQALAAADGFKRVFPLGALLALILVSLLAVRQIRARLAPLRELTRGTLRIAEQDFDVRLQLTSGDEFEEVGHSFNLMAERLRHQFDSLTTLIEIDRAILEATDAPAVVKAVLADLPRVCPCDAVTIIRFGRERCEMVAASVEQFEDLRFGETQRGHPSRWRQWLEHRESADVNLDDDRSDELALLREMGMRRVRLLPMRLRGELVGAVGVAWLSEPPAEAIDDVVYASRVADQAAVALDSANVHEENRTLAYFDSLTDLPNRLLFRERLDQALLRAGRVGGKIAVCLFDLDGFKRINDSLGHSAGDRLLALVSARAREVLRNGELARFGGDEFTILFNDVDGLQPVVRVVERLLASVARPYDLDGREVTVTATFGIALYPDDGTDAETLLKSADVAMYHAKEEGRNSYQFFSEAMTVAAVARMQLEQDLRQALGDGELRFVYQAIVSAQDLHLVGAEALMRWDHPTLGTVPPTEFIPVAEEAGLIVPMGDWALQQAAQQARRWELEGASVSVSVNVSPRQFRDEQLVSKVRSAVERSQIDPARLTLEITEGLLMSNEQWAVGRMTELKRMGVKLAIDDFGTGYSSFAYLKYFPVDSLKLDRCLVRDVEGNAQDAAIARAIIHLGHSLGMEVVAEGIETEGQERVLVEAGCDRLQGFRYGRPQEADSIDLG